MGRDDEFGVFASRDGDRHRWRKPARRPAPVDDLSDRADVNGITLDGFDERGFELRAADNVEDLEEPCGRAADVAASLGDNSQERLTTVSGTRESIKTAVLAGALLLVDESLEVVGLLDLLTAIPRT